MDNITKLKENMNNIVDIIVPFYNEISLAEDIIRIKGKTLQQANYEQASWFSYYDQKRAEIQKIHDFFEQYYVLSLRGEIWRRYTERISLDLNTKDKEMYVNNEAAFVERKELLLEIKEIVDKFKAICNAFEARGYALKNLTELHVNSLQDVLI